MNAPTAIDVELWTPSEVDKKFRLRRGTARKVAKAGLIPCVERLSEEGTAGLTRYFISPEHARAFWGPR